jgi:hypothetical protein
MNMNLIGVAVGIVMPKEMEWVMAMEMDMETEWGMETVCGMGMAVDMAAMEAIDWAMALVIHCVKVSDV